LTPLLALLPFLRAHCLHRTLGLRLGFRRGHPREAFLRLLFTLLFACGISPSSSTSKVLGSSRPHPSSKVSLMFDDFFAKVFYSNLRGVPSPLNNSALFVCSRTFPAGYRDLRIENKGFPYQVSVEALPNVSSLSRLVISFVGPSSPPMLL